MEIKRIASLELQHQYIVRFWPLKIELTPIIEFKQQSTQKRLCNIPLKAQMEQTY